MTKKTPSDEFCATHLQKLFHISRAKSVRFVRLDLVSALLLVLINIAAEIEFKTLIIAYPSLFPRWVILLVE